MGIISIAPISPIRYTFFRGTPLCERTEYFYSPFPLYFNMGHFFKCGGYQSSLHMIIDSYITLILPLYDLAATLLYGGGGRVKSYVQFKQDRRCSQARKIFPK